MLWVKATSRGWMLDSTALQSNLSVDPAELSNWSSESRALIPQISLTWASTPQRHWIPAYNKCLCRICSPIYFYSHSFCWVLHLILIPCLFIYQFRAFFVQKTLLFEECIFYLSKAYRSICFMFFYFGYIGAYMGTSFWIWSIFWPISGHFIVICGYDAEASEFEIRDPASSRYPVSLFRQFNWFMADWSLCWNTKKICAVASPSETSPVFLQVERLTERKEKHY